MAPVLSARLRAIAAETVEIVRRGGYTSPAGAWVDLREDVARAVAGTRLHLPGGSVPPGPARSAAIEVTTESTLEAGRRLGPGTAALVFASARKPGGGFLSGAKAQEEDIARASALHACLSTVPEFYTHHRAHNDLRYSDRVIYSPDVPVFRGDDGSLLADPYRLSFLTAAAPNQRVLPADLVVTVPAVAANRAVRILSVAAEHEHTSLVLGAWGCGVFGNSPDVIAAAFEHALTEVPRFDRVVFAVLDRTGEGLSYRTFAAAFRPSDRLE